MTNVGIVGGGASGIMAAFFAASSGAHVHLFEQNEKLGKKIYITGKGRCNITNACDIDELFKNTYRNPKFLYSSFSHFNNMDLIYLLESYGLKCKIERGGRVFPKSDKSSDVISTLQKMLEDNGVHIHLNTKIQNILQSKRSWILQSQNGQYECDRLIIATGGYSYPLTGSTGDGHTFAEQMGLSIEKVRPALVGFTVPELVNNSLAGLTLKNVSISVINIKKSPHIFGDLLFTHQGVSGPIVLELSSLLKNIDQFTKVDLALDLKPALDPEKLDRRLLREIEEGGRRQLKNMLKKLLPEALIPFVLNKADLDGSITIAELTREHRLKLRDTLKALPFLGAYLGPFKEAIITRGGISVNEIHASTMECKRIPNLFFAGEILDLDASTGGFNLQIAFSTGALAGKSASQTEEL